MTPYATNLASLSPEHVAAVQQSGRFADLRWRRCCEVAVTTLDALVAAHGPPAFVKIDVEGYELEVLKGLSRPVPALSFEIVAERLSAAEACVERLETLGSYRYGFSEGETLELSVEQMRPAALLSWLHEQCRHCPRLLGDVDAVQPGSS